MLGTAIGAIKGILPDWPDWALDTLLFMTALLLVTVALTSALYTPEDQAAPPPADPTTARKMRGTEKAKADPRAEFDAFRRRYILVYLVIMLADWMQGTHMYTLYLSYNVNISALFLTGFLSGACFAPFLGSAVDRFGRRNSCIAYCVLEIVINCLEHSTDFTVLLIGRVMGGVSTNLLFSAFESWMTTEHRKRGFPEEWLSRTYSAASVGNGAMAILAGIVAQLLEDAFGHIGPFQGAIALTALALLLVLSWEENYGEQSSSENADTKSSSVYSQFIDGWSTTLSSPDIWKIGMIQALSEGAMYTFVFMWVPTLLGLDLEGGVPTGCIFSALMMAITIGGMLYPPIQTFVSTFVPKLVATEACASIIYLTAGAAMAVPAAVLPIDGFAWLLPAVLGSFMVVECCVGLFMPVAGTLRSKYVPDALQGSILNIFRLPLNVVVVSGTYASDVLEAPLVFKLVSGCFLAASALQCSMAFGRPATSSSAKKDD